MNVAKATATVARTSWPPLSGAGGAGGAAGAAGAVLMGDPDESGRTRTRAADDAEANGCYDNDCHSNELSLVCQRSKIRADYNTFIQI
jgi:hypothetical protein